MNEIICPIDGKPCEQDCTYRYVDRAEGGCFLTTVMELGANVIIVKEGLDMNMPFCPLLSAANEYDSAPCPLWPTP